MKTSREQTIIETCLEEKHASYRRAIRPEWRGRCTAVHRLMRSQPYRQQAWPDLYRLAYTWAEQTAVAWRRRHPRRRGPVPAAAVAARGAVALYDGALRVLAVQLHLPSSGGVLPRPTALRAALRQGSERAPGTPHT